MLHTDVGDDCIPNDSRDEHEQHYRATELHLVGYDGNHDSDDGCDGVWDDGPELCFIGGVAELDDYGGEEETE